MTVFSPTVVERLLTHVREQYNVMKNGSPIFFDSEELLLACFGKEDVSVLRRANTLIGGFQHTRGYFNVLVGSYWRTILVSMPDIAKILMPERSLVPHRVVDNFFFKDALLDHIKLEDLEHTGANLFKMFNRVLTSGDQMAFYFPWLKELHAAKPDLVRLLADRFTYSDRSVYSDRDGNSWDKKAVIRYNVIQMNAVAKKGIPSGLLTLTPSQRKVLGEASQIFAQVALVKNLDNTPSQADTRALVQLCDISSHAPYPTHGLEAFTRDSRFA